MALPTSTAAYQDCFDYFDQARHAERGIRILVESQTKARHLSNRLHQARALERRDSARIYDRTDPRHGKSENDGLQVTIREAADGEPGWWVYIQPWSITAQAVEEL